MTADRAPGKYSTLIVHDERENGEMSIEKVLIKTTQNGIQNVVQSFSCYDENGLKIWYSWCEL